MKHFKSIVQLLDHFKDEQTCIDFLEQQKWNGQPVCPHCQHDQVYRVKPGKYRCKAKGCCQYFTVRHNTIYADSRIPLRIWFGAIYLYTTSKKGLSSVQLATQLNITQKTAWFLAHRIREAFVEKVVTPLEGVVEVDEMYVGGLESNKHINKKDKDGRGQNCKHIIIGFVERGGRVRMKHLPNTNADTMQPAVVENVSLDAHLISDAHASYKTLWMVYDNHTIVKNHSSYRTQGTYHTNTIEGFWSIFKRGYVGIYQYMSKEHIMRYCNEFAYRYNTRRVSVEERFEDSIKNLQGVHLNYKQLTGKEKK